MVVLYTSENKPTPVQEYLANFIDELRNLLSEVIVISHQVYTLSLVAFLCDALARSFLKGTIGHAGYWSCESCLVKESWSGRVVFNDEEQHSLRTDNDFVQMLYQNHQNKRDCHHCLSLQLDVCQCFLWITCTLYVWVQQDE